MSQIRKIPRPTGLPVRTMRASLSMVPPSSTSVVPPLATRRGSLVKPTKSALRISSMARDVKSVQDIAALADDTTCVRKSASYSCLKQPPLPAPERRKVQIVEDSKCVSTTTPTACDNVLLLADCQRVLQSLHSKSVRNSSEFDESVASLLSENIDLLDVRFDISVASGTSEAVDRTPSVEDLPMECEATTPGQVISSSMDTGYQGDGELSRPESRNAESEVRLIKTQDDLKAMTDSDFFTESDADCHDETGLNRRRDRKAQVIDGTLYGGPSERSQAEDMESSGIYSDLERKPDPPSYQELISQQIETIKSIVTCQKDREPATPSEPSMVKSSSGDSSSTILETPTVKVSPTGSVKKETVRKNKMPNRNVESKLKALLASETRTEAKPRTPKRGKWDEVMNKIAAGREKQPLPSIRQVKSKVYQAVNNPRGGSGCPSPISDKARSRRSTRVRSSESSLVSPKSKQARSSVNSGSINSTPHSSISDLSVTSSIHRSNKKREAAINNREHSVTSSCREIKRSRDTNEVTTKGIQPISNVNAKATTLRRPNTFRSINATLQHSFPLKDVNQNGVVSKSVSNNSIISTTPNIIINSNSSSKSKTVVRPTKNAPLRNGTTRPAKDPVPILRRHLDDSNKAVEALAALLNYCTHDLDAFNTPSLKKHLEAAQCKIKLTEDEVNCFRTSCLRLEEELRSAQNLLNDARSEMTNAQSSLESEQKRFIVVQKELEGSQASCCNLEHLLKEAQVQLNLIQNKEAGYKSQIALLNGVTEKFEQTLTLKNEAEQSLEKSQNEKCALEQLLKDKECEIKMLSADNAKLREKVSWLSTENKALKDDKADVNSVKDAERAKPLDVKWGENREASDRNRLYLDQRLTTSSDNSEYPLLNEVESLRQVLALKTEEVSELHRMELHLKVEADRVPKLLSLVTTLEAKVEDLQSQLSSQNEIVRNLSKVKETLQDELRTESSQKSRLSLKNEELQYKLRVNSEAVRELVRMNLIDERTIECSSITSSPRSRPQMVGMVQKSESVSYMLDMGEDAAEIVSNIVRRAETARSQTLPKKRRSRTLESADTPAEYFSCGDASPGSTPRRPARSRACVRLLHSDFATDSIELPREADCEVIEITGSFDRPEPEMSCSTSSSSSSNFDIESEVYADSPVMTQYPPHERLAPEGQDVTPEPKCEQPPDSTFHPAIALTLPSAGEAMVSSDEE